MSVSKNQKFLAVIGVLLQAGLSGGLSRADEPAPAPVNAPEYSEIKLVEGAVDGLAIEKAVNTCLYFGDRKKGSPALLQEIIAQMSGQELPEGFRKQIKPRSSELTLVASNDDRSPAADSSGKQLHLSKRGLSSTGLADLGDLNNVAGGTAGPAGAKILGIQAMLHPTKMGTQEMRIEYYPSEDARGEDKPVRLMARMPYPFAEEVQVDRGHDSALDVRASKARNLTLRIPRGAGDFFVVDEQGIRLTKSVSVDTTAYVNCLREQF